MDRYQIVALVAHATITVVAIAATVILAVGHVIGPDAAIPAVLALAGVSGAGGYATIRGPIKAVNPSTEERSN